MTLKEREIIKEVESLILQLPSGIDMEADEQNPSPEEATAHVGGLIWQKLRRLLDS